MEHITAEQIALARRRIITVRAVIVAALGTATIVTLLALDEPDRRGPATAALATLQHVVMIAGGLLLITFIALTLRARYRRDNRNSVVWALPRRERRRILAAIRRNKLPRGMDPTHARDVALGLQRARLALLLITGSWMLLLGNTILWNAPVLMWATVALIPLLVVAGVDILLKAADADTFLARRPR